MDLLESETGELGRTQMISIGFTKYHLPCYHAIMALKVTIDRAGRIVLPKPVRDRMQLTAGTAMELEGDGERITLRPMRPQATLRKESGIWVFQGPASDESIPELVGAAREKRLRELKG
jgi:AbrB family looped-hinge helix DNA binding protein